MGVSRRMHLTHIMSLSAGWSLLPSRTLAAQESAAVPADGRSPEDIPNPGRTLRFPRDFGAHPGSRTEWWYLTGSLQIEGEAPRRFGFQITFFRSRTDVAPGNPSAFAPHQLLFAHAAVTDLAGRRLLHDQRLARAGFGLAEASTRDTAVRLRNWTLRREGPTEQSRYLGHIEAGDFVLDLRFDQTQPVLLQGQAGFSRKGPDVTQASHYYSHPQLRATGHLTLKRPTGQSSPPREAVAVTGLAWMDHEWSETVMHPDAVGWDWIGMNLADGSALTAFRLRRADGSTLWTGGSWRAPGQPARAFTHGEVQFAPGRVWRSPATGAAYPVSWTLTLPQGRRYTVQAELDNQELDSRGSTGSVYWEGLSVLRDATGQAVGSGYLEMTGYASRLAL